MDTLETKTKIGPVFLHMENSTSRTKDPNRLQAIRKMVTQSEWLPAPSSLLAEILANLDDNKTTIEHLEQKLNKDPSLVAQILKVANSAYYGFQGKIETLSKAIVIIGIGEIRTICLNVLLIHQFKDQPFAKEFQPALFWRHSLCAAYCAEQIAQASMVIRPDSAYTMGLIHDLGRLAMAAIVPEEFASVATGSTNALEILEKEVSTSVPHWEIGGWLAEKWNLPGVARAALKYHHHPEKAPLAYRKETSLVYTANLMATSLYDEGDLLLPAQDALTVLDLDLEGYDALLEEAMQSLRDKVDTLVNLLLPGEG